MENDFNEKKEEVLNNFDFEKVARVMRFLNWTWAGDKESPSVYQLIKRSSEMLDNAFAEVKMRQHKQNPYMNIQTCGFSATVSYYEGQGLVLNLEFLVASWRTEC